MSKESLPYVIVFTFIVAFAFVFVIAFADGVTAERVAQNQKLVATRAFLNAVGYLEDEPSEELAEFAAEFGEVDDESIIRTKVGGRDILIKRFSGQALWGTVSGVIAVDESVSEIIGFEIISQNETPGLGGRIEESWFTQQFRGETIPPEGIIVAKGEGKPPDYDTDNGSIDGITGASLTSARIEKIVNSEISQLRKETAR